MKIVARAAGTIMILLAFGGCATPAPPRDGPPLYVAEQGNAKIYLFGGAIISQQDWLTPQIQMALDTINHLWEEDPPGKSVFNRQLNIELGTRKSGTLFDDLTKDEEARVMKAANVLGIKREQLAPMLPWAAGAVIAALNYPKYAANNKLDDGGGQLAIQKIAQARGIPITGEVDQWDDWVRFYASFPQKAAVQYLLYQIDITELPPDAMTNWSKQWLHGDLSGWLAWNDHLRTSYPDLYAIIEVGRNEKWARRIDSMLKEGGTHFISVGIEHTVGPASIQALCLKHGVKFRRL